MAPLQREEIQYMPFLQIRRNGNSDHQNNSEDEHVIEAAENQDASPRVVPLATNQSSIPSIRSEEEQQAIQSLNDYAQAAPLTDFLRTREMPPSYQQETTFTTQQQQPMSVNHLRSIISDVLRVLDEDDFFDSDNEDGNQGGSGGCTADRSLTGVQIASE